MTHSTSSLLTQPIQAPYPGLRPFQPHESAVFFGRDEHVADMLTVLENQRFLAVVGPSGGGKSSLVLAGLIPSLERGELLTARSDDWRFVILRPGDSPYRNLAEASQRSLWPNSDAHPFHDGDAGLTELILRSSPFGFVEMLRDAAIPEMANVLLLVDQFEELFRFRAEESSTGEAAAKRRDDAATFVQLLLETAKQSGRSVYVMLTMRSDFLGECDVFDGLPQAINQSQYLTPRLNLTQLSEAIIRPLQHSQFQGSVAPELVQRILNDVGTGRDELPIVQHALFRTWQKAKELRPSSTLELTLSDYDAVGSLKSALSIHADEALNECQRRVQEPVAEKVFRGLCTRGTDGQQIRRPVTIQQIADESGVSPDDVKSVVESFRRTDRCFLMPPVPRELTATTKIDISHEAIIRQWQILNGEWFCREDDSKRRLLRVVDDANKYALRRGNLLAGVELDDVEQWWREEKPTAAWVRRYVDAQPTHSPGGSRIVEVVVDIHAQVREFITLSRTEQIRREKQVEQDAKQAQESETRQRLAEAKAEAEVRRGRLLRGLLAIVGVVAVVAVGLGIFAAIAWSESKVAGITAMKAAENAREAKKEAERSAAEANRESSRAFSQIANDAREKGDSIKATHSFLRVANSLHEANAPVEEHRNILLAAQFAAANVIRTIPQVGTSVVLSRDGSRLLAWGTGDRITITLWDVTKSEPLQTFTHESRVNGARFGRGEARVMTWSDDKTARLWDVTKSEAIQTFQHYGRVNGAQFSRDESHVLTWSDDNTARLWDVTKSEPLQTFTHESRVNGARFGRGEARVMTWSDDKTARLWDVTKSEAIQTFQHYGRVNGAQFSRDDARVLTWSDDKTAQLWDVTKSDPIQTFQHESRVNGARFSRDDARVLTWSSDSTAQLWDVPNGAIIEPFKHGRPVEGAQFSRDESRLLIWGGDRTCLWDVNKASLVGTWTHDGSVISAQFNQDESLVLTWSADNKARIWNVSETQPIQVFGHDSVIRGAQFTNHDAEVLTWSADGTLKRWHARPPGLLQTIKHESPVGGAILNEEAKLLLTWCFDALGVSKIQTWEISGDQFSAKTEISEGGQLPLSVQGALLSRDGLNCLGWSYNTLASMQGEALLWNLENSEVIRRFEQPQTELASSPNAILGVSWNADEKRVLTWGFDNTANLWDVSVLEPLKQITHADSGVSRTGKPIAKLNGGVLSTDGKTILTWSDDRTARLWDAASGKERRRFSHKTSVRGAIFAADDSCILTWTGAESDAKNVAQNGLGTSNISAEVSVWKAGNTDPAVAVLRHEAAVNGASMSRNQTQVLTCSDDGTAVIWDLKTQEKLQSFRHQDAVLGAKFLRGDSLVLTWSRDKTAALWDASRKLPLAVFSHDASVDGALTNNDDTRMLTWSRDRTAKWWDISLHDEQLTPDERILEFEVRSATRFSEAGEIVPLNSQEWRDRSLRLHNQ